MRIYEVRAALEFQSVVADDDDKRLELGKRIDKILSGERISIGDFIFSGYYVSTPKQKRGNFFNISSGLWMFDDVALDALKESVQDAGELFKVSVEEVGLLNVLNVTEVCEHALDHENSRWWKRPSGGTPMVTDHVFSREDVVTKSGLFLIPENRFSRTLAATGAPNQVNDFYKQYCEAGLTGLDFSLLWDDKRENS